MIKNHTAQQDLRIPLSDGQRESAFFMDSIWVIILEIRGVPRKLTLLSLSTPEALNYIDPFL